MTVEEFEAVGKEEDKMMITVHQHKTARSLGTVEVVIGKRLSKNEAIQTEHQKQSTPSVGGTFTSVFPNIYWQRIQKINEWIQEISAQYHLNVAIPNPTIHRKWIDSAAHAECTDAEMRVLNKLMSHSEATSLKHYQKQKTEHALQSVQQIQHLSKKYFTKEDDNYFRVSLNCRRNSIIIFMPTNN